MDIIYTHVTMYDGTFTFWSHFIFGFIKGDQDRSRQIKEDQDRSRWIKMDQRGSRQIIIIQTHTPPNPVNSDHP